MLSLYAVIEMACRRSAILALMVLALPAGAADTLISRSPDLALTEAAYREYLTLNPSIKREQLLADEDLLQDFVMDVHSNRSLRLEAEAAAMDEIPAVRGALERARTEILVEALMAAQLRDIEYSNLEPLARERYLADRDKYREPERRKVSHILLGPNPYPCRKTGCAPEITAETLREKLEAGGDFAELAQRYSLDPGTACAGGLLNRWLTREDRNLLESFKRAAFELKAVGDLSPPVSTRFGTHLIRLDALEEGRQLSFEEVENKIVLQLQTEYRHSLLEQKRAQAYPDWRSIDFSALRKLLAEGE